MTTTANNTTQIISGTTSTTTTVSENHGSLETEVLSHCHTTASEIITSEPPSYTALSIQIQSCTTVSEMVTSETPSYTRLPIQNQSCTTVSEITFKPPSYTTVSNHEDTTAACAQDQGRTTEQLDIRIDVQNENRTEEQEENIPFSNNISFQTLSNIVKEKNLVTLRQLGGVKGIAIALNTNLENGICTESEDYHHLQAAYGLNTYRETIKPSKGFLHIVFQKTKDWTIMLLFCCAALSLGSGIIKEGLQHGWYDGATICIIILVLIVVSSLCNFWRTRKVKKPLRENTPAIGVLRDGRQNHIPILDVVVGDIVLLEFGDCIPADGLFVDGENFIVEGDSNIEPDENPFLFSGTKVVQGSAHMLVTAVGMNTTWAQIMSSKAKKQNLLKSRLHKLNSSIQNIGLILTMLILAVLLMRFKLGKRDSETGFPDIKGKRASSAQLARSMERLFLKPGGISVTSLTAVLAVLLVTMQEGLASLVSLCLSLWTKRMLARQCVILKLSACTTMGSVTTICADKTVRLTLEHMEVDIFWIGEECIDENIIPEINQDVLETLKDAVGMPALVSDPSTCPMKDPLLHWAKSKLGMDMEVFTQHRTVVKAKNEYPEKKRSALLMRKHGEAEKNMHLHWKGAAEKILQMCCHYYDRNGNIKALDDQKRASFEQVIGEICIRGLQSIAFAYKQVEVHDGQSDDYELELHEDGLTLLGFTSLKYPCCEEAIRAVADFLHAGVGIKLVSTDSVAVVRTIATECGIYPPDQGIDALVLEGDEFRNLSEDERMEKIDRILGIASSTPSDMLLLVKCLKGKGHVVAVTGTRISDFPALKEADVGILMGRHYSGLAKRSAEIVILNSSLASILNVMLTGRCAYKNIQKFIQLELTMSISGLLIISIATVSFGESPISGIQLFLANLMVGTLAVVALITEPPTTDQRAMGPVLLTEPLVTMGMWRNIVAQVLYQAAVFLIFQVQMLAHPGANQKNMKSIIFNGFILNQVFNQFNARELEKKNSFKTLLGNYWFLVAVGLSIVFQVVLVEFATGLLDTARLNWKQWLGCIITATISCPIDYFGKGIPGFASNQSV